MGETLTTSDVRLYHSSGRKQRRTKESLDEGERGEGKSWVKTKNLKPLKKTIKKKKN